MHARRQRASRPFPFRALLRLTRSGLTLPSRSSTFAVDSSFPQHDTQVGQSLESWVNPQFKPLAYALTLLRVDGFPCVFWGDLYGCGGENPQQPMSQLGDFIRARKWFAYGELRDYWDHPNCAGWLRMGDDGEPSSPVRALDAGMRR